jgi:hypothetical protein
VPHARTMVNRRSFHVRTARRSRKMRVPFGRAEHALFTVRRLERNEWAVGAAGLPAAWRQLGGMVAMGR